jgi:hypothetical protein
MVLRAMAIQSEEELRARLEAGARLAKDRWGFKVWDPKTNRWERVSAGLRDVAAALYAQQRRGGGGRRVEGAEGAGVEEDYSYIVGLIRQKIDSRAPILQKWVNDIAWWQHLINDTSARLLPDLLSMLGPDEVDLEHPERTVAAIVRHYAELKSRAREAEAALKRYEAALRIYMDRARKLEGELRGTRRPITRLRSSTTPSLMAVRTRSTTSPTSCPPTSLRTQGSPTGSYSTRSSRFGGRP